MSPRYNWCRQTHSYTLIFFIQGICILLLLLSADTSLSLADSVLPLTAAPVMPSIAGSAQSSTTAASSAMHVAVHGESCTASAPAGAGSDLPGGYALPVDKKTHDNIKKSDISLGIISFYQKYISPVDGDRCPMYPSCSKYFRKAVKKHGWIKGWIMGMDRIVRCGRDEVHLSPKIWKNGRAYTYDPVKNNDFWWSDK